MPSVIKAKSKNHAPSVVDRRTFLRTITQAAAAVGLSATTARRMAGALAKGQRPSVIWLHYQECTGCTESLLRTSHPGLAELVLDLISLDYHETLMAAAGHQAEAALHSAMEKNAGKYICIVEGAIPLAQHGTYMRIGGRTGADIVKEVAKPAALVIGLGSCASWGGLPSADPNPTGAVGVQDLLPDKKVIKLPGCPANPYILLGVALQFATMGQLPQLDNEGRPLFAYGRTIHEHCPRRAHFDAGRFAVQFGDAGHRQGYCLYKLGCKGPATHASCSTNHFCEVVDAWPIGAGAPCFGCTEKSLAFRAPMYQTIEITRPQPPATYPGITAEHGSVSAVATGVAGLAAGVVLGAGVKIARVLQDKTLTDGAKGGKA
ncbi:MAG TPA: hydrogenase small subunit [Bryobacteraceae bacterium]|nr:hydrogenase small subunit [Bryobacteraceae bacterium]